MEFRIASTFSDSLTRLTNTEQSTVKATVVDLQLNPAHPGLQMHRLDKVKDQNFWSVRASQDVRLIIHREGASILLCYVDHHDKAYKWAENRKIEVHPKTGAAQIVELRESVKEIIVPKYVESEMPKRPVFEGWSDDRLLGFGVPSEWLDDVKAVTSEDQLLQLVEHLPGEASDALLTIADGGTPEVPISTPTANDPFDHPDALRRFRVMNDIDELNAALEFPWDKWAIFLHPGQREIVTKNFNGPARVSGSAGTGKTIVALHRAAHLARNNRGSRVLLTTFSPTLANNLRFKLQTLIRAEPRLSEQIDVYSMDSIARRLYELKFGKANIASDADISEQIRKSSEAIGDHKFTNHFLISEWKNVVDSWNITEWEDYRDVARLGRRTRLPEAQRKKVWPIFAHVRESLFKNGVLTESMIYSELTEDLNQGAPTPFDFAVVDEAQDLSPAQLRFLAALARERDNGLFFAGDLGQRIFQQAFSWLSLGVDIRGRSRNLKINYRTSHQIRSHADKLLGVEVADVDGVVQDRRATISIFNGIDPEIRVFDSVEEEISGCAAWIEWLVNKNVLPHEIAVFVRSVSELDRARSAVAKAGLEFTVLDTSIAPAAGSVSIGTMNMAKGLEFRGVVVMACEDEVIPSQTRIEKVTDDADLEEIYNTERHLLYVACTRARDFLFVSAAEHGSEFLEDLIM